MSALSNLAGLYPPTGEQKWNPNLDWQPIPVHTLPVEEDIILSNHPPCPKYDKLFQALMNSSEIRDLNKKYDWVYKYATEHSGKVIDSIGSAAYLYDTLHIETIYNKTLPPWTSKIYPEPLGTLQNLSFHVDTWTTAMKRLRFGSLVKAVVNRMSQVAAGLHVNGSFDGPKMIMYSAHDTTVSG